MNKQYNDVPKEILDREFEVETPSVIIRIRETKKDKNDNTP